MTHDYDAFLLLSFGGPERPEDILPFLENVTRGRGVPRERLLSVAEHYHHLGGKSPLNDQNRALIAALRQDFLAHGIELPIFFGNRNWAPLLGDTLAEIQAMSHRLAAARLVDKGVPYAEVAERVGGSTTTVTRVAHWLRHGEGGYRLVLDRLARRRR